MRVSIVGAGAIGTAIGVRLARAGHAVSILARGATLRAIHADGLRLHDLEGTHTAQPPASDDPLVLGPQDVVFVCTKTTALAEVLPRLGPMLGPDTIVVPAINGVPWWYVDGAATQPLMALDPDGVPARAVPAAQLLGCVVYITAEALAPAVVRANNPHRLIVGEIDGGYSARAQRLVAMLGEAGIATEATDRIRDFVWTKILSNLSSNPLSVLTGATLEQIYGLPSMRPLVKKILGEAMLTAAAVTQRRTHAPVLMCLRKYIFLGPYGKIRKLLSLPDGRAGLAGPSVSRSALPSQRTIRRRTIEQHSQEHRRGTRHGKRKRSRGSGSHP